MTKEELWVKSKLEGEYEAWSFGEAKDKLLDLVLKEIKRGTSSAYDLYKYNNEEIPNTKDYSILLDSNDNARCIIKNKNVLILPFKDVNDDIAILEGEGDKSLKYWKEVHENFFKNELKTINKEFDENILIVFEEFELIYKDK